MSSAKAEVAQLLETLPEESSLEDIQYHLYVMRKVARGKERAISETTLSNEQARERLEKWISA
jgi:hypothetical protein